MHFIQFFFLVSDGSSDSGPPVSPPRTRKGKHFSRSFKTLIIDDKCIIINMFHRLYMRTHIGDIKEFVYAIIIVTTIYLLSCYTEFILLHV